MIYYIIGKGKMLKFNLLLVATVSLVFDFWFQIRYVYSWKLVTLTDSSYTYDKDDTK